ILLLRSPAPSLLTFLLKKIPINLNTTHKLPNSNFLSQAKHIHQPLNTPSQILFYLLLLLS
ncbi:hypothetical protein, partial [Bacillus subtilis]|uniref:hypothetical protein n=1 Tax=Bacillus subtilis TaxID=1423 RepID=UPI003F4CD3A7